MTKLPLVVVEWNDAWIDGADPVTLADVAASHKPKVIVTLGYVLRDDDIGLSLANEYYEDESTYRGRTFIPRSMVKKVTTYKLSRPRADSQRVAKSKPGASNSDVSSEGNSA